MSDQRVRAGSVEVLNEFERNFYYSISKTIQNAVGECSNDTGKKQIVMLAISAAHRSLTDLVDLETSAETLYQAADVLAVELIKPAQE